MEQYFLSYKKHRIRLVSQVLLKDTQIIGVIKSILTKVWYEIALYLVFTTICLILQRKNYRLIQKSHK